MSNIEIGSKVTTPVTDNDGEVSFLVGVLVSLNQRYATVDVDGRVIKVGKTKIELFIPPVEPKRSSSKKGVCPQCGGDEHVFDYNTVRSTPGARDMPFAQMYSRYWCQTCDRSWGPRINRDAMINPYNRGYCKVAAASGRRSVDNGDEVALMLRGKPLDEVYDIVAKHLDLQATVLKIKYGHLNDGQQRMNLGNRLRKVLRDAETVLKA